MIRIPAGEFRMGSDDHYPEEAPSHLVSVDAFEISSTTVTNEQFTTFVEATGYVTVAERPLDPADFPGAPTENLVPGSLVFTMTPGPVDLSHLDQWWTWTPGASWTHPEGPRSSIGDRADHPVVDIDGARVDVGDGAWFLVRASNTTPNLTVRFEARDDAGLTRARDLLLTALAEHEAVQSDVLLRAAAT